jgi:DNA primase
MAPVFSADIIARVKDETDIVELVRQHVSLKAAGSVFKGLCPFHKEKTPSFIVTPSRGRYHCFGCEAGGDVITFIMEIEGVSFPEAVEILARPLDIDLSSHLGDEEAEGERRAFHRANETAMKLWREHLWDGPARPRDYMLKRGFTEKTLREFDIGWAPGQPGWLENNLAREGVDSELAHRADLLRRGDRPGSFAYFRNRIIFPIKQISRQVVGFGGRVIDEGEPKYLNSADSVYFSKGRLLYGFDLSRMPIAREKTALLVEGYLDLMALAQVGIRNVVATCGTAFTEDQARLIRRGAQKVLLVFDGDKAGLKAAVRSADTALRCGLEPRIVSLPAGEDPASLVVGQESAQAGAEAMHEILGAAQGYLPFLKGLADAKGSDREYQERALRQALGTMAGIKDSIKQEFLLQEATEVFGLPLEVLRQNLEQLSREQAGKRSPAIAGKAAAPGPPATPARPSPHSVPGSAEKRRRRVPQLGGVNPGPIEEDMLSHILWDGSGEAARAFLDGRDDLILVLAGAETLAGELGEWAAAVAKGPRVPPRDFILGRWNEVGDRAYRSLVSRLLDREDHPAQTDFKKVISDCLDRLKQGHRPRQG